MAGAVQVDSQTLRDTGVAFGNSAGNVADIVAAVSSSMAALDWTGGIAVQFTEDFTNRYKPMLEQLRADMEETQRALVDKAAEYDLVFHGNG